MGHRRHHPLKPGQVFTSPGGTYKYRVVGPCCRLFDREQLPWPCCRLEWHGKEPSWRRIGKRFIADLATERAPSYSVEILGPEAARQPFVLTLYCVKLPQSVREWWYSRRPQKALKQLDRSAQIYPQPKECLLTPVGQRSTG